MSERIYPVGHKVPKYNVLLLSCIDLRLNDNIVHFMDHENLTNRYDQYIMAGVSIGGLFEYVDEEDKLIKKEEYFGWWKGLTDHVTLAIELHDIRDIYIIEHRNCGAYKYFLKDGSGNYEHHGTKQEFEDHLHYAGLLAKRLKDVVRPYEQKLDKKNIEKDELLGFKCDSLVPAKIRVQAFLMDLTGNVEFLPINEGKKSKPSGGENEAKTDLES